MSELKVYRPRELVMQGRHNETIYLKPEADRHINWIKRKRCLAMALLWLERAENSTDLENELVSRRRCSKWMELAEVFK